MFPNEHIDFAKEMGFIVSKVLQLCKENRKCGEFLEQVSDINDGKL